MDQPNQRKHIIDYGRNRIPEESVSSVQNIYLEQPQASAIYNDNFLSNHSVNNNPVQNLNEESDSHNNNTKNLTSNTVDKANHSKLYTDLLSLNISSRYIKNNEPFECEICYSIVPPNDGVVLRQCLHQFCTNCSIQTIIHSETILTKCPSLNGMTKCIGHFEDQEIRALLSPQQIKIYDKKSLTQADDSNNSNNLFHCCKPNCSGWYELVDKFLTTIVCHVCDSINCVHCKVIHQNGTCPRNQEQASTSNHSELYNDLLSLNITSTYIRNDKLFECEICHSIVLPRDGVVLRNCLHQFCKNCSVQTILHSKKVLVQCPSLNGTEKCFGHFEDQEIRSLLSAEQIEIYDKKNLIQAEDSIGNLFHCRKSNCTGWYELDNDLLTTIICQICGSKNCINCKAIHENETCFMYQERVMESNHSKLYNDLLRLNISPSYIKSDELFECGICFSEVEPNDGAVIRDCLHQFCINCSVQTILHSEKVLAQCPSLNGTEKCFGHFQDHEIRSLLSPQQIEIYDKKILTQAEGSIKKSFHCCKPNCLGWYELADDLVTTVTCEVCGSINCINCKAVHENETCAKYQERAINDPKTKEYFIKMKQSGQAMNCPNCNIILMKLSGCDAITCSMCKTQICWATKGPRWGPGGLGDNSGGCKCKLNGRLCHPKCGNCH